MTNYEHIQSMTMEEMEDFLVTLCADVCMTLIGDNVMPSPNMQWLKEEAQNV